MEDQSWDVLLLPNVDRMFDALREHKRRVILLGLLTGEVDDEADVYSQRSDRDGPDTELYHRHLPMLSDLGYVEWDPDSGDLARGPRFDEIQPLLGLLVDHADELPPDWR